MVLVSAGVVGFAFFLMELVWYRLLGPLLGGTVFAFGLILAVALAGIGAGSAFYTWFPIRSRAASFALTCLLEALLIAVPFALGDRIALLALMLRPLGGLGFAGLAFGWVLVCSLVVLPAAFVSGAQFPLLIALLGRGRENVGREVGQTYAANTLGAIAGALAGGFGLLPALGALGCYRFAAGLLLGWGVVVALLALRGEVARLQLTAAAAIALASVLLLSAQGPTAAFRHSPIGAGRVDPSQVDSPNAARAFLRRERQGIVWQAEGVESVVALEGTAGLAFVVNGKIDGNARADAGTQVMLGLVGAPLVPQVKTALVVGLGTGSSAGWLAKLPGIERVDVAEIEPAIVEVAKRCAAVNESVSDNPKVHVFRGDARELLAVSRTQYDLIVSEPSNPYRAGIASLYTQDFYERVAMRLSPHGLFVQWVQSYEIDAGTVRTIYATLDSVFPFVETYRGMPRDLFLIGSRERPVHDAATLRARVEAEPMARALRVAWRTQGVEGYLAHFVAGAGFAKAVAQHHHGGLSTDDLSPIEFAFGRYLGRELAFSVGAVLKAARTLKQARPEVTGDVDWARVDLEREVFAQTHGQKGDPRALQDADRPRFAVMALWSEGRLQEAFDAWQRLPESVRAAPITAERVAWAEAQVNGGGSEAEARMQELAQQQPTEAAALRAAWFLKQGKAGDAANAFADAFTRYRNDPWPSPELMERALRNLQTLGTADRKLAPQLDTLLQKPFSVRVNDQNRQEARMALALALGPSNPLCVSAYAEQEPNVSWTAAALGFRAACYAAQSSPLRARAEEDLAEYDATAPPSFADLVH
jgi:spermidine synthase